MVRFNALALVAILSSATAGQTTLCATIGTSGFPAQGQRPSISDDGRYVSFENLPGGIVSDDTNGSWDIFVFDRATGSTERVSLDSAGAQIAGHSTWSGLSGDGRYVSFTSSVKNIVPGDVNVWSDVFVRDRVAGTTTIASVPQAGGWMAGGHCSRPVMNADGRYVLFESFATNLVVNDGNLWDDVFVRDRTAGTTERASQTAGGTGGDGDSYMPHVSGDGRWVVFTSKATNFAPGVTNGKAHIYRKDRQTGALALVSAAADGGQANDHCYNPRVSDDGRWITFESWATNLVANDSGFADVFVRDMLQGQTRKLTVDPSFGPGTYGGANAWISGDGLRVAFESFSQNLVALDLGGVSDVFTRDLGSNLTTLQSVSTAGVQGDDESTGQVPYNGGVALSRDGRWLAFNSQAGNLVPGDSSGSHDVFLRGPLPLAPAPWAPQGQALAGIAGKPQLQGQGTLAGGSAGAVFLSNARTSAAVTFVLGLAAVNAPFKGGTLVPDPQMLVGLTTDAGGSLLLPFVWPFGVPPGAQLWIQMWLVDPAGIKGFAASNGLRGTTP